MARGFLPYKAEVSAVFGSGRSGAGPSLASAPPLSAGRVTRPVRPTRGVWSKGRPIGRALDP